MDFHIRSDLSQDHYNVLQSELFRHISAFSGGPKIVLTRLCVAVSEVAIYVELQQKINVTSWHQNLELTFDNNNNYN